MYTICICLNWRFIIDPKESEIGESSKKRKSDAHKTDKSPKKKVKLDRPDFFDILEQSQPFNLFLSKISTGLPSYIDFYTADIKSLYFILM